MLKVILAVLIFLAGSTYSPLPVETTDLDTYWRPLCEARIGKYTNITFRVKNTGSTNPFTDCRVVTHIGPEDEDTMATGTLEYSGQPGNNETVVIDTKTYTFQTSLTDSDGNVQIGSDVEESFGNLVAAITLGAGAGTKYASSTTAHPSATAVHKVDTDEVIATATVNGSQGNTIATTDTVTDADWAAGTMGGGIDAFSPVSVSWDDCKALAAGSMTQWAVAGSAWEKLRVEVQSTLGTDGYCKVSANGP